MHVHGHRGHDTYGRQVGQASQLAHEHRGGDHAEILADDDERRALLQTDPQAFGASSCLADAVVTQRLPHDTTELGVAIHHQHATALRDARQAARRLRRRGGEARQDGLESLGDVERPQRLGQIGRDAVLDELSDLALVAHR